MNTLCVDVGSTFTKAVLVEDGSGTVLAAGSQATLLPSMSPSGDVLDAVEALRARLAQQAGVRVESLRGDHLILCSSAGGGLRLAVVGYERLVSAQAGHRVALSAGGKVVHVHAGPLDSAGIAALRATHPDVVLLVGGTDGGNAQVLLHNASKLAAARITVPIVLAGNAAAAQEAAQELTRRARTVVVCENVLPRIGQISPGPARAAIRQVFLQHVIGGKGLSRKRLDGRTFAALVQAPTPDAVLDGVGALAAGLGDCLVLDIGGATTDVYSVIDPDAQDGLERGQVVEPLWHARTVEGDLGMRWSAPEVVQSAQAEGLLDDLEPVAVQELSAYAQLVSQRPGHLPGTAGERAHDTALAALAARIAVRRHGRGETPGAPGRPLREVRLLLGGGGVLRHGDQALRAAVLGPIITDHGGGWKLPREARWAVDERYVLFAAGLLAPTRPQTATALLAQLLT